MGEVISFRRARLTGFLPDDLGEDDAKKWRHARRAKIPPLLSPGRDAGSIADLIPFAKKGAPPEQAGD
jgi:hypothetical protein